MTDINPYALIAQKAVLEACEGKLCLVQSGYYPESQGSLYVHAFHGVHIGDTDRAGNGRNVEYDINRIKPAYFRTPHHPKYDGVIWHRGWGNGCGNDSFGWPVRLNDVIFVLNTTATKNLENKLDNLPKKPKQLTVKDLKKQFPSVVQVWPITE
jgi:hypothetical protein